MIAISDRALEFHRESIVIDPSVQYLVSRTERSDRSGLAGVGLTILPGMVFAIEPFFFQDGVGSLGIEENILITENGCENLTPSPSDLIIIGG